MLSVRPHVAGIVLAVFVLVYHPVAGAVGDACSPLAPCNPPLDCGSDSVCGGLGASCSDWDDLQCDVANHPGMRCLGLKCVVLNPTPTNELIVVRAKVTEVGTSIHNSGSLGGSFQPGARTNISISLNDEPASPNLKTIRFGQNNPDPSLRRESTLFLVPTQPLCCITGQSERFIEAWIRFDHLVDFLTVFQYGLNSAGEGFSAQCFGGRESSGAISIVGQGGSVSWNKRFPEPGYYHHVIWQLQLDTLIAYVDGQPGTSVPVSSLSVPLATASGAIDYFIGGGFDSDEKGFFDLMYFRVGSGSISSLAATENYNAFVSTLGQIVGGSCSRDEDCNSPSLHCVGGVCSASSISTGPCLDNSDCSSSTASCIGGSCSVLSDGGQCDTLDDQDCASTSPLCMIERCLAVAEAESIETNLQFHLSAETSSVDTEYDNWLAPFLPIGAGGVEERGPNAIFGPGDARFSYYTTAGRLPFVRLDEGELVGPISSISGTTGRTIEIIFRYPYEQPGTLLRWGRTGAKEELFAINVDAVRNDCFLFGDGSSGGSWSPRPVAGVWHYVVVQRLSGSQFLFRSYSDGAGSVVGSVGPSLVLAGTNYVIGDSSFGGTEFAMVRVWDSVPTSTVIESWADRIVNQIRFQDGQSCTFDEECRPDLVCFLRECSPPSGLYDPCSRNSDCHSASPICNLSTFKCTKSCSVDADCSSGVCDALLCQPLSDFFEPCTDTSKCQNGLSCQSNGRCGECLLDSDCPAFCVRNECVPSLKPSGELCEGNDDCDSNLCGISLGNPICIDCSVNSDCLPPLTCINGVCQNPSRIGGACDLYDDADCRDGYCFSLKCHDPTAFTAAESALILLRATSDASELTASTWKSIGSISDTLTNSLGFTSFPSINTIVRNRIEVVFDGTSYMRGSTPLSSLNGNSPFTVEAIIANTDANEGRYRDVEAVVVFGRPQSHGQSFYACFGVSPTEGGLIFSATQTLPMGASPPQNNYNHVIWTYDGAGTAEVYINGVLTSRRDIGVVDLLAQPISLGQFVLDDAGTTVDNAKSGEFNLQYLRVFGSTVTPVDVSSRYYVVSTGALSQENFESGCRTNLQCSGTCIDGICAPLSLENGRCDDNDDCAEAFSACARGMCSAQVCGSVSDCPIGAACILFQCKLPSVIGGPCDENSDCMSSSCGSSDICGGVNAQCSSDQECFQSGGLGCVSTTCQFSMLGDSCSAPTDCPAGVDCGTDDVCGGEGADCAVGDNAVCYDGGGFVCIQAAGDVCQQAGTGDQCDDSADCSTGSCSPGNVCGGLDATCANNGECDAGLDCISFTCQIPSSNLGDSCSAPTDCPAGVDCGTDDVCGGDGADCAVGDNAVCYDGGGFVCIQAAGDVCQQAGTGDQCDDSADCSTGSCSPGNVCGGLDATCANNGECDAGLDCISFTCQIPSSNLGDSCSAPTDCPAGVDCGTDDVCGGDGADCAVGDNAVCYDGGGFVCIQAAGDVCQQAGTGDQCDDSADCSTGSCSPGNVCGGLDATCANNGECDAGLDCISFTCQIPSSNLGDSCSAPTDCPAGVDCGTDDVCGGDGADCAVGDNAVCYDGGGFVCIQAAGDVCQQADIGCNPDSQAPEVTCLSDVSVVVREGIASIAVDDVAVASDNCEIASESLSQSVFTCQDYNSGDAVSVGVDVVDEQGNSTPCQASINLVDLDEDLDGYTTGGCNGRPYDCNDANAQQNPETIWYTDADGDGYGDPSNFIQQCEPPPGSSLVPTDCNDHDELSNPVFIEVCGNGIDDNCNGQVDEDCGAGNNAGNDDEETLADAESALSNVQRDQLNSVLSDIAALPPMCGDFQNAESYSSEAISTLQAMAVTLNELVDGDTAILPSQFNTIIVDSLAESMLTVSCRSEEIGGSSRETLSNSVAALLNSLSSTPEVFASAAASGALQSIAGAVSNLMGPASGSTVLLSSLNAVSQILDNGYLAVSSTMQEFLVQTPQFSISSTLFDASFSKKRDRLDECENVINVSDLLRVSRGESSQPLVIGRVDYRSQSAFDILSGQRLRSEAQGADLKLLTGDKIALNQYGGVLISIPMTVEDVRRFSEDGGTPRCAFFDLKQQQWRFDGLSFVRWGNNQDPSKFNKARCIICRTDHFTDFGALFNGGSGGGGGAGSSSGDQFEDAEYATIFAVSWFLILLVITCGIIFVILVYRVPSLNKLVLGKVNNRKALRRVRSERREVERQSSVRGSESRELV